MKTNKIKTISTKYGSTTDLYWIFGVSGVFENHLFIDFLLYNIVLIRKILARKKKEQFSFYFHFYSTKRRSFDDFVKEDPKLYIKDKFSNNIVSFRYCFVSFLLFLLLIFLITKLQNMIFITTFLYLSRLFVAQLLFKWLYSAFEFGKVSICCYDLN